MTDTPGLGRPDQDDDQLRHTLTVHEISDRLAAADGVRDRDVASAICRYEPRPAEHPHDGLNNGGSR